MASDAHHSIFFRPVVSIRNGHSDIAPLDRIMRIQLNRRRHRRPYKHWILMHHFRIILVIILFSFFFSYFVYFQIEWFCRWQFSSVRSSVRVSILGHSGDKFNGKRRAQSNECLIITVGHCPIANSTKKLFIVYTTFVATVNSHPFTHIIIFIIDLCFKYSIDAKMDL